MTDTHEAVTEMALAKIKLRPVKSRRVTARWPSEIKPHLSGRYLVKHFMSTGLLLLYGKSNSGKTAIALALAISVAGGLEFCGRRTRRGLVVWVALEAPDSLENRLLASCQSLGVEPGELIFAIVRGAVDLRDARSAAELAELIDEIEARAGEPPVLIVLDTLARAMPGANENDGADMGRAIAQLERLAVRAGDASLLLLHHTGKDETRGARGSSALPAAADGVFECRDGELRIEKARDAKIGEGLAFTLAGVEIGRDEDGEPVTAVVATPTEGAVGARSAPRRALTDGSKNALRVLRDLLRECGLPLPSGYPAPAGTLSVQLAAWRARHRQAYGGGVDADASGAERKAWTRALEQLQAARIVVVHDELAWACDKKESHA